MPIWESASGVKLSETWYKRWFEHCEKEARTGVWLERPSPDIGELTQPIIVAMKTHHKFRNASIRFFGSKQLLLNSRLQSQNLLKIAVERGPSAAVAWCHKVYSTEKADLRYVAEVYGLEVAEPLRLSNDVSLMPLEKLPPSANAEAVQSQFYSRPGNWNMPITSLPIGATYEATGVVGSLQSDTGPSQTFPPRPDELERTISWHSPDNRECAKRVSLISCRDIGHSSYTGIIFRIARLLRLRLPRCGAAVVLRHTKTSDMGGSRTGQYRVGCDQDALLP